MLNQSFITRRPPFAMFAAAALFAMASGCASFEKTISNAFIDDDGYVIYVDNGRRSRDHVFMVESPGNGKLVEYKSKLMVKVTLPDGTRFSAFQTLNPISVGTMYKSDDEKWIYLTNGLMCRVYSIMDDGSDYVRVYEGNLTKGPED